MAGEGLAIESSAGVVVTPFNGEVVQLFPTEHVIGLRGKSGHELLIHIGFETVALGGKGFEAFVKQGDQVKQGDKRIAFDLDVIAEKASSTITPIVMTNGEAIERFKCSEDKLVIAGESTLMSTRLK